MMNCHLKIQWNAYKNALMVVSFYFFLCAHFHTQIHRHWVDDLIKTDIVIESIVRNVEKTFVELSHYTGKETSELTVGGGKWCYSYPIEIVVDEGHCIHSCLPSYIMDAKLFDVFALYLLVNNNINDNNSNNNIIKNNNYNNISFFSKVNPTVCMGLCQIPQMQTSEITYIPHLRQHLRDRQKNSNN